MKIIRPNAIIRSHYRDLIWQMDTSKKQIALTFDDGPQAEPTQKILDILDSFDAKATFFCVGENAKNNPELIDLIKSKDHIIGNHTYNHLKGWKTDLDTYIKNVEQAASFTSDKIFRPPYGKITKEQAKALITKGYKIIMWSLLSYDYDNTIDTKSIIKKLKAKTKNGSIAVFHDSQKAIKNAEIILPEMLHYWKKEGYEFVTI